MPEQKIMLLKQTRETIINMYLKGFSRGYTSHEISKIRDDYAILKEGIQVVPDEKESLMLPSEVKKGLQKILSA